ncbi:MAG: flagellar biosynthetic protein FliO [Steroidobacteraceae bacterium]
MSALASSAAAAAGPAPFAAPAAAADGSVSTVTGAGEVTVALLLVLLVIFACAWCVRRLRNAGRTQGRVLAIVDDLCVGQKEHIVLVSCGAERLLVGVAPGEVRLLQIVPPEAFANATGTAQGDAAAPAPLPVADFRAILRRSLGLPR